MQNRLKTKWAAGEPTLGAWLAVPTGYTAEVMARLGFDWVTVDMQHGLIDYQRALEMLQAISSTDAVPLVRVPWNEPGIIGKMLDAGALGIIVPMISSRADCEAAVRACRYPPLGRRSFGPIRAAIAHGRDYFDQANDQVLCIPMIETREALDELDAVLSVQGVDAIYVGPNDLSLSLGLPPRSDHDDAIFTDAIARIVAGCRRHGVIAGSAATVKEAPKRLAEGFLLVEVARDGASMAQKAAADLAEIQRVLQSRS